MKQTSHPSISLDLNYIRYTLIRLEDSILFALIERAQFAHNAVIYKNSAVDVGGEPYPGCFLQFFFRQIEEAQALARRYQSPDEYSYSTQKPWPEPLQPLPSPVLPPLKYPKLLHPNDVNVNSEIYDFYVNQIVPELCRCGRGEDSSNFDDLQYGSSATCDVTALQHISRRIHYGKFVAESKFQSPELRPVFEDAIRKRDVQKLDDLITDKAVEERVIHRLRLKAAIYGQEVGVDQASIFGVKNFGGQKSTATSEASEAGATSTTSTTITSQSSRNLGQRIDVDLVVELYKKWIIPLTKKVEVAYLLQRLDNA